MGFVIRRVDGNPFLLLVVWFRIFESPFQCNLDKTVPFLYQPGLDYSQIESYVFFWYHVALFLFFYTERVQRATNSNSITAIFTNHEYSTKFGLEPFGHCPLISVLSISQSFAKVFKVLATGVLGFFAVGCDPWC